MSDGKWTTFTFCHGQGTGYKLVCEDMVYTIIPTNGRAGSFDVLENDVFVGETFATVEEAKEWVG